MAGIYERMATVVRQLQCTIFYDSEFADCVCECLLMPPTYHESVSRESEGFMYLYKYSADKCDQKWMHFIGTHNIREIKRSVIQ